MSESLRDALMAALRDEFWEPGEGDPDVEAATADRILARPDVRAALQRADAAPEGRKGYVLDYDAEERWLVMSDPEGASEIVARDVRAVDAPYLIAGYNALAAAPSEPEPPALDVERARIMARLEAVADTCERPHVEESLSFLRSIVFDEPER